MAISFTKLQIIMDAKGLKKYDLRKAGFHGGVLDKVLQGGRVDTITINKLCAYFNCQPGDLMEYVEDKEGSE